jgi:hypothetical protein
VLWKFRRIIFCVYNLIEWVPYGYGMELPRFHILMVIANGLNKKHLTTDKVWPSGLVVGRALTVPQPESPACHEI